MEDHSAAIRVICWFLVVMGTGVVGTRIVTKWLWTANTFSIEIFTLIALISSIAAGITVSFAAQQGLGRSSGLVSDTEIILMQKLIYVAEIFHVLTICFSKLSLAALLHCFTASMSYPRAICASGVLIALWGLSSLFVTVFQCRLPQVWNLLAGSCIDMRAFWRYFGIMNILIDTIFVAVIVGMVCRLQMSLEKKLMVVGGFGVRIIDIGVTVVQLYYTRAWSNMSLHHRSLTIDLWPWFICGQVLQTVTLISASVPYLRDFLEILPSGMFQTGEIRRQRISSADIHSGYTAHNKNRSVEVNEIRLVNTY